MRMPMMTAPTRGLSLASVLLIGSLGTGCLRLGYREVDAGARALPPDAGTSNLVDAGAAESGNGGTLGAGSGSGAAAGGMDAARGGSNSSGSGASRAGGAGGASGDNATSTGGDSGSAGSGGTSAIMDAGSDPGDAATDAGTDAGTNSKCPERPEALFCDGFEDPTFSRWNYPLVNNGSVAQSTAHVRTDAESLRAATGNAGPMNQARYSTALLDKQMSGDIWLRYYNYLPASTVITSHFSSGVVSEVTQPYDGVWVMVLPNRVDIGSWINYYSGTQAFPRDRWVCVELHVHVDASAGQFELFLDGTRVAFSPATLNSVPAKGYTSAEIGIHYAESTQGPVEVFVEDVVLARVRVPCD